MITQEEREVLLKILCEYRSKEEAAKELNLPVESVNERFESGIEKQLRYLNRAKKASSIDVYIASPFGRAIERNEYYFDPKGFDINIEISDKIESMGYTTFSPAYFIAEVKYKGKLDTIMLRKCRSIYAVMTRFSFGTIEEVTEMHMMGKPVVIYATKNDIYNNINGHTRRFCHYIAPKDFDISFKCLEDALTGKEEFEYIREERALFNDYVVLKKCKRCGSSEPLVI